MSNQSNSSSVSSAPKAKDNENKVSTKLSRYVDRHPLLTSMLSTAFGSLLGLLVGVVWFRTSISGGKESEDIDE